MANRIFCDHCGEECEAPLRQEWYAVKVDLPKKSVRGHLCEDCAVECAAFFGDSYPHTSTGAQSRAAR